MKRLLPFLFAIYVVVTEGGQTIRMAFLGMPQDAVETLMKERTRASGGSYSVVSKQVFDSTPELSPGVNAERIQAILDAKNTSKTADERINALLKIIDLR